MIAELSRLRGLCCKRIIKSASENNQFGITRWATLNNYFADLENAQIRAVKKKQKLTFYIPPKNHVLHVENQRST